MKIFTKSPFASFQIILEGFLLLVILGDCRRLVLATSGTNANGLLKPVGYTIRVRGAFHNNSDDGHHFLQVAASQVNVTLRLRVAAENVTTIRLSSSPMIREGTLLGTGPHVYVTRAGSGKSLGRLMASSGTVNK